MRVLCVAALALTACNPSASGYALDGDTFVQSGVHYRIAAIDAPELPGHCRGFRARFNLCAPGNPFAAKAALTAELRNGIRCTDLGPDYYGRTLVRCETSDGQDLGSKLIAEGHALPYVYHGETK